MCSIKVIKFDKRIISKDKIEQNNLLEIGSFNVNASIRSYIKVFKPSRYVGIDIMDDADVDMVLNAYDIKDEFRQNSFEFGYLSRSRRTCKELVE